VVGWSKIIRRESLVLYKSFNTVLSGKTEEISCPRELDVLSGWIQTPAKHSIFFFDESGYERLRKNLIRIRDDHSR
jgi:hypothetical protein